MVEPAQMEGLLNNEEIKSHISPTFSRSLIPRVGSKKFVQQGRSHFCARSVWIIREHKKLARTPLTAFFNRPLEDIVRTKTPRERELASPMVSFFMSDGLGRRVVNPLDLHG